MKKGNRVFNINSKGKRIWPKLRSKDKVIVISGEDRGRIGQIEKVIPKKWKIIIPDIGMVKKHKKKTQNTPGVIIDMPRPIHLSNVMFYCNHCKKGCRISIIRTERKKVRLCQKCRKVLDKK